MINEAYIKARLRPRLLQSWSYSCQFSLDIGCVDSILVSSLGLSLIDSVLILVFQHLCSLAFFCPQFINK